MTEIAGGCGLAIAGGALIDVLVAREPNTGVGACRRDIR